MGHVVNPKLYRIKYVIPLNLTSVTKKKYSDFFDLKILMINNFVNSYFFNYNKSIHKKTVFLVLNLKLTFKYNTFVLYLNLKQTWILIKNIRLKLKKFKKVYRKKIKISNINKRLNIFNLNLKLYSYWFVAKSKMLYIRRLRGDEKKIYANRKRLRTELWFKRRFFVKTPSQKRKFFRNRKRQFNKIKILKNKKVKKKFKNDKFENYKGKCKSYVKKLKKFIFKKKFKNLVFLNKRNRSFKSKFKKFKLLKDEFKLNKIQLLMKLIKRVGKKHKRVEHRSKYINLTLDNLKFKLIKKKSVGVNYLFLLLQKKNLFSRLKYNLRFIFKKNFKFRKMLNYVNKKKFESKFNNDKLFFKKFLFNKIWYLDKRCSSEVSQSLKKKLISIVKSTNKIFLGYRDARKLNMSLCRLKNKKWYRHSNKFFKKNFKQLVPGGRQQTVAVYQALVNLFWLKKLKNKTHKKFFNIKPINLIKNKKIKKIYNISFKKTVKNPITNKYFKKYSHFIKKYKFFDSFNKFSKSRFKFLPKKSIKRLKRIKKFVFMFSALRKFNRKFQNTHFKYYKKMLNSKRINYAFLKRWRSKFKKNKIYNKKLKRKFYFFKKKIKKKYLEKRYKLMKRFNIKKKRRSIWFYNFYKKNFNLRAIRGGFKNYTNHYKISNKLSVVGRLNQSYVSKRVWELGLEIKKSKDKKAISIVQKNIKASNIIKLRKRLKLSFLYRNFKYPSSKKSSKIKKRLKFINRRVPIVTKKFNKLKTRNLKSIIQSRFTYSGLIKKRKIFSLSNRQIRGKFIISNYFKFKDGFLLNRSEVKNSVRVFKGFQIDSLFRKAKNKILFLERLKKRLEKKSNKKIEKKVRIFRKKLIFFKNISLRFKKKYRRSRFLKLNKIKYLKYQRKKKLIYNKKSFKRRLKMYRKLKKKPVELKKKIIKFKKKLIKVKKKDVSKTKNYKYNFYKNASVKIKNGFIINKLINRSNLYNKFKFKKKLRRVRRLKKRFFILNRLFKYFFSLKIFLFKDIFVKSINKFLSYKTFIRVIFIIKKLFSTLKSADMFAEAMIIRLLKKNPIRSIIRSVVYYFKKYLLKGYIGGYSILFAGRFTRKDRAMHLFHRGGLYSRSNRVVNIDYSNKRVALKYSSCSFKISLIKSIYKKKC